MAEAEENQQIPGFQISYQLNYNIMIKSTIKLKYKTKPVYLEVDSGYSSLGSFSLATYIDEKYVELFPERVKIINDNITDVFLLPFSPDELCEMKIYIFGKYGPSPNHSQVLVKYNFVQGLDELPVEPKDGNKIEEDLRGKSKRYFHSFDFKF